jgi:uncharacterized protein YqhQ
MRVSDDFEDLCSLDDATDEGTSEDEKLQDGEPDGGFSETEMYIGITLAVIFLTGLVMLLPVWLSALFSRSLENTWVPGIFEGLLRLLVFGGLIFLISRLKVVRQTFMYHGAEHKAVHCYENGEELTAENAGKHSRLHKRCGTSFAMVFLLMSMAVFFFIRIDNIWLRLLSRLLLTPLIAGLSFEIVMWTAQSTSKLAGILSVPGMWLQKLTTVEPDDAQVEVAIEALCEVLADDGVIPRKERACVWEEEAACGEERDGGLGCVASSDEGGGAVADGACDEAGAIVDGEAAGDSSANARAEG